MSPDAAPGTESSPSAGKLSVVGHVLRVIEIGLLVLLAWAAIGLGDVCIRGTEQQRHRFQLERIASWAARAQGSVPAGMTMDEWRNVVRSIDFALGNRLYHPRYVPTDKVRALADELDATRATELATVEGVIRFMAKMEEICPNAVDYGPFEMVRTEYPAEAAAATKPK